MRITIKGTLIIIVVALLLLIVLSIPEEQEKVQELAISKVEQMKKEYYEKEMQGKGTVLTEETWDSMEDIYLDYYINNNSFHVRFKENLKRFLIGMMFVLSYIIIRRAIRGEIYRK